MKKNILLFLILSVASVAQNDKKTEDPVCKMQVAAQSKLMVFHQGKTYNFCSSHCKNTFIKNPAKFVTKNK